MVVEPLYRAPVYPYADSGILLAENRQLYIFSCYIRKALGIPFVISMQSGKTQIKFPIFAL